MYFVCAGVTTVFDFTPSVNGSYIGDYTTQPPTLRPVVKRHDGFVLGIAVPAFIGGWRPQRRQTRYTARPLTPHSQGRSQGGGAPPPL